MSLAGKRVGFAVTGSFCTLEKVVPELARLVAAGAEVTPLLSGAVAKTDTRYGSARHWREELERICGRPAIASIPEAEPIGPKKLFDLLIVAPCTGNTIAKLANGIVDSPVLMGIKAHLRNQRPVVLAISTNDGLGMNAKNIGLLLNAKLIYLVPFGQDNPQEKVNSLDADVTLILDTALAALNGKQLQPVLIERVRR